MLTRLLAKFRGARPAGALMAVLAAALLIAAVLPAGQAAAGQPGFELPPSLARFESGDELFRVARAPNVKWMRFGKRAPNGAKWMRFGKRADLTNDNVDEDAYRYWN